MKDRLVAIKKAGLDAKVDRLLVLWEYMHWPYRSASGDLPAGILIMPTGKVIIFEDAKKKAFLQEAQIMKDRGQIGFGCFGCSKVLQWGSFPNGNKLLVFFGGNTVHTGGNGIGI